MSKRPLWIGLSMMLGLAVVSVIAVLTKNFSSKAPPTHVLRLAELNTEQVRSLDKKRTVVLLSGGILEQHGPYLPSFTDGYRNEWATDELARFINDRPGWTALVFPTIPLGVSGANHIGRHYSFPGTYSIRSATMRDIFVDLGSELGEQGFEWIFIVHLHGAPLHHRAMDEAGEYFRDTFGGRMVNLYGLLPVFMGPDDRSLPPAEEAENGLDIHAGRSETSAILYVRPDLVAPGYRSAPSLPGKTFEDLVNIARAPDWPGYFGAPKQATADEGGAKIRGRTKLAADFMWRIVEGTIDERQVPRIANVTEKSESHAKVTDESAARERAREERFAAWQAQRKTR